jgi:superfamily II DNA or RNA helicase
VAPSEIYFTYKGDTRRHSLQQVMELREEAWFRKGVALAPECNKSIVDASIQRMRELRARTGQKHQIIAAACSIDHARQVRALYEQRGLSAREVYSEMDEAKQERAMAELENLQIDCVVQVQMLGEGFDHPPLSVAAVFRPFRSLSPYVQFVGRIMRVMFQDDPANAANHGYVVSHVGLNNDANWRDFREFDLEDQQVFREWLESQGRTEVPEGGDGGDSGQPRRFDEQMLVHGELISDFVRQSFLDPGDDRILDKILDAVVPGVGVPFRSFMSRDQARDMLKKAQEKMLEATPQELPVTPQRRRQAARKRVADRPRSVAARILKDLGLSVAGYDVAKAIPGGGGSRNLAEVIRLVNREINERLGIANRQRGEVPAADLEAAMKDLDAIGDSVASRIGKALTHAKN